MNNDRCFYGVKKQFNFFLNKNKINEKKRQLPFSILIKLQIKLQIIFYFRNTCNHQFALVWPLQYLEFLAEAGAVDDGCNQ